MDVIYLKGREWNMPCLFALEFSLGVFVSSGSVIDKRGSQGSA